MEPNYEWYSEIFDEWYPVYVDPQDGSVYDIKFGEWFGVRWSDFEQRYKTRPLFTPKALDTWGPEPDMVNSPSHYGQGSIEAIEYIEDFLTPEEYIGYLRGNIAKYMHRWRYKNGLEDLRKANWYLDRLTSFMEDTKEKDLGD